MESTKIDISKVTSIEFDSRKVTKGSLFVAIKGVLTDGHQYIAKAVELGASVVVCEELPMELSDEVEYFKVEDSHRELAQLAAKFYGNPSHSLEVVGVTGTNGKTTTATLLYHLFEKLGYCCGLLSTVENIIDGEVFPSTHTTPNPVELNRLLALMVERGCQYCFMEVSSHSLVQRRCEAIRFRGGIFTNLTHDHLDYHGTFAEYLRAKKSFFDSLPASSFALTNLDDRNGEVMLQNCKAHHKSYSLRSLATYRTKVVENHLDGTLLRINSSEIWVQFIGRFNAYNLTAIYGAAIELGADEQEVLEAMSQLIPVSGRFETIRSQDNVVCVVDYAHTPDALKNVLDTINELQSEGRVITVVGCGGDRDSSKRPIMAQIAVDNSGQVILTSDNPRTENPADILNDMTSGLDFAQSKKAIVIENRHEAIKCAASMAVSGDIILIAGKGHETYQEVNGVRSHFDDKEEILSIFNM